VRREWSEKKQPHIQKSHTRFFLSSLSAKEKSLSTTAARNHWSIENRNHHKRDASAWQEDRHRHRRPRAHSIWPLRATPCLPSFHSNKENPWPTSLNFTTDSAEKPATSFSTRAPF
jgi:predicted transposase YbfD/YdcC